MCIRDSDGDWSLGFDPKGRLGTRYRVAGTELLVIGPEGESHWETDRVLESDRYVRNVERVLEATEADADDGG